LTGIGVRKNTSEGFNWLEKASKQGDNEALAIMKQAFLDK
jgi:TPR repeat protein